VKIAPLLAVSALVLAPPAAFAADPNATDLPPGPTATTTWVAKVVFPTVARAQPGGGRIVARLATTARWNHGPNQLKVLGSARDKHGRAWLHVLLPIRPNGAKGWMLRDYALLSTTPWRIDITLRRRLVRVYDHGVLKRHFRIVIGKPSTPTPPGHFFVIDRLRLETWWAPGTTALMLSAYAPGFQVTATDPGEIALHSRGILTDPLGSAASHGCVRFAQPDIDWLVARLPAGTPVDVRR
jgi:hypothetical protein